jgi:hypothetical protein
LVSIFVRVLLFLGLRQHFLLAHACACCYVVLTTVHVIWDCDFYSNFFFICNGHVVCNIYINCVGDVVSNSYVVSDRHLHFKCDIDTDGACISLRIL